MKFTSSQLNFLMSYLTIQQIEEIRTFSPQSVPKEKCSFVKKDSQQCKNFKKDGEFCITHSRPVSEKIIVESVKCESIKKNGSQCRFKAKQDGKCSIHLKKTLEPLAEVAEDS